MKKELEKRIADLESWVHFHGALLTYDPQTNCGVFRIQVSDALNALIEYLGLTLSYDNPSPKVVFKKSANDGQADKEK